MLVDEAMGYPQNASKAQRPTKGYNLTLIYEMLAKELGSAILPTID